jgi:hypothetical protein
MQTVTVPGSPPSCSIGAPPGGGSGLGEGNGGLVQDCGDGIKKGVDLENSEEGELAELARLGVHGRGRRE